MFSSVSSFTMEKKYGLDIESVEKQFTVVTYRLPLKVDDSAFIRNGGFYHEIS